MSVDNEKSKDNKHVLNRVKFLILLILLIPSLLLYILIFTYFLTHRFLLRTLQNQALLISLLVNFIAASCNLPMVIRFYHLSRVSPATSAYCKWWTYFQYTLNVSSGCLMATISIQRHILIFNSHILRIRRKRILLYYLPLLLCIVYPTLLYFILVVIYPCDRPHWKFSSNLCGLANCYLTENTILATFDWILNAGLTVIVITVANVVLVIRVVWQKRCSQQPILWKKQRHMTLHLLRISCLYIVNGLLGAIIGIIGQLHPSDTITEIHSNYIYDLVYLVCLFIPWLAIENVPQFKPWLLKQNHRSRIGRNTVVTPTHIA